MRVSIANVDVKNRYEVRCNGNILQDCIMADDVLCEARIYQREAGEIMVAGRHAVTKMVYGLIEIKRVKQCA